MANAAVPAAVNNHPGSMLFEFALSLPADRRVIAFPSAHMATYMPVMTVKAGYPDKADRPQSEPASIAGHKLCSDSATSSRQIIQGRNEKETMNEVCSAFPV